MARGRKSEAVARLFAAVYPLRDWVEGALETLRGIDLPGAVELRHTPAEQVHLTVQFIGQRREAEIAAVVTSIERACSGIGRFELTPIRVIGLPVQNPRVIAVETEAPAELMEIHRRLVTRLARKPRIDAGDRFVPHVTVGRVKGLAAFEAVEAGSPSFEVREVVLCRSVLTAAGAEHSVMARVRLG